MDKETLRSKKTLVECASTTLKDSKPFKPKTGLAEDSSDAETEENVYEG